jgi:cysteine-rich repeat protein
MIIGSSGDCMEICGDGFNFGLQACDDGNLVDEDGCSSSCEIEHNWECSGGSSITADTCSKVEPFIKQLEITENNNVIIRFNEPVFVSGTLSDEDFEIRIQRPDQSYVKDFSYSFEDVQELPSQSVYARMTINEFLRAKENASTIYVTYKRSGRVFNEMLTEVTNSARAKAYLNKHLPPLTKFERDITHGLGILCNMFVFAAFGFTIVFHFKL